MIPRPSRPTRCATARPPTSCAQAHSRSRSRRSRAASPPSPSAPSSARLRPARLARRGDDQLADLAALGLREREHDGLGDVARVVELVLLERVGHAAVPLRDGADRALDRLAVGDVDQVVVVLARRARRRDVERDGRAPVARDGVGDRGSEPGRAAGHDDGAERLLRSGRLGNDEGLHVQKTLRTKAARPSAYPPPRSVNRRTTDRVTALTRASPHPSARAQSTVPALNTVPSPRRNAAIAACPPGAIWPLPSATFQPSTEARASSTNPSRA